MNYCIAKGNAILTSLFFIVFSNNLFAQAGTLDLSFGDNGKVVTQVSPFEDAVRGMVIQQDHKIIVQVYSLNTQTDDFKTKIIRYSQDGIIDSTFGINGIATIDSLECFDLQLKSSGKILVSGNLGKFGAETIIQLNKNGSKDATFGENGKASFSPMLKGNSGGIAIQADNKIVITSPNFGLVRFKSDGLIDSSFGEDGITKTNGEIGWGLDSPYQAGGAIKIQPDNKILIGGIVSEDGMHMRFVIVRYTAKGIVDSTFGIDGKVISTYAQDTSNYNSINDITGLDIQSDNKIVCGGGYFDYTSQKGMFALARFNLNGVYDSSFGINGKSINDFNSGNTGIGSFTLQSDDKIVATGYLINNYSEVNLARYLPNGFLDQSFGSNGYTITSFSDTNANPVAVAFQDNKIVVASSIYQYNSDLKFTGLTRYNNASILAVSFLNFNATKTPTSVLLNWQTTNETDKASFLIERMNGNNNWAQLTSIAEKGNSTQIQSYSYEDLNPLQGENYYRLKQIDDNGNVTYSKIASVDFENGNIITVFPNPASSILNIKGLDASQLSTLIITDEKGKITENIIVNSSSYSLNIKALNRGIYFLKVIVNNKASTIKFVKN